MKRKGTIFITGATGLVGSLLTMRALWEGHSVRLLVRRRQNQSSEERIRLILTMLGLPHDQWDHLRPDIEIYEGDIAEPQFGLSGKEWQQLADGLSATYHAAAFCGFQNHQAAQSRAVNIGGTRNILKLAELSRAHLFHISSAYIAGDTETRVFERELETPPRWKNPYEETKFIAEHHVHSHCRKNGLIYTVFRPAVLIGDSVQGRTIRFTGMYHYMKLFHQLSARRKAFPVILEAKPGAKLNIVPVDFAIGAIWDISQFPECEGKVFHITNPSPRKFAELISIAERLFELRIELVDQSPSGKATSDERDRKKESPLSHYRPYLFGEPEFDVTNTRSLLRDYDVAFPELNESYFRKILNYAVDQNWGKHQFTTLPQRGGEKALTYTERYFEEFLMGKLHQQLVKDLKSLSAIVSLTIHGEKTEHWVLQITQGTLGSVCRGPAPSECSFVMDAATFEEIARGRYQPQQAFFEGRVNIEGNMEKALQVATALAEFCKSYPFEPKDDVK